MEMIKRNRLSELYALELQVKDCIASLEKKPELDFEDKALLEKLTAEIGSIHRRIDAVKGMPEEGE